VGVFIAAKVWAPNLSILFRAFSSASSSVDSVTVNDTSLSCTVGCDSAEAIESSLLKTFREGGEGYSIIQRKLLFVLK